MGGEAGAEGSVLPGMTLGLATGIGIGMVGTLLMEDVGVLMGRGRCTAALPCRDEYDGCEGKRLLWDCEGILVRPPPVASAVEEGEVLGWEA